MAQQMMANKPMMAMARQMAERMHRDMMAEPGRVARKRKRKPGAGPPVYRGKSNSGGRR